MMPVLTFHAPYATMLLHGLKAWETRSRPAPTSKIGQRIAIHQGTRAIELGRIIGDWQIQDADDGGLGLTNYNLAHTDQSTWLELPLGCILGTALLERSLPVLEGIYEATYMAQVDHILVYREASRLMLVEWVDGEVVTTKIDRELPLGHYQEGRHVWAFTEPELFEVPVPFRGGQGWSRSWDPTDG